MYLTAFLSKFIGIAVPSFVAFIISAYNAIVVCCSVSNKEYSPFKF
ncbi:hypothetical protein B4129_1848 [Bacillus safensis]|nr:hypothetical protein B4129_1848 [Bacillus safensis]